MMYDENINKEQKEEAGSCEERQHQAEQTSAPLDVSSEEKGINQEQQKFSSANQQNQQQPYENPQYNSQPYGASQYQQYQNYNQGPRYYNWQNEQEGRQESFVNHSAQGSKDRIRKKASGSLARKAAGITAAALLFGTVSGGTMVGINMLANNLKSESYTQVSQSEVLTEETAPTVIQTPAATTGMNITPALDVSGIVEQAMPSVVSINNTMRYESSWFGQRQTYEVPSSGSGIIVGQNEEELLIVTNNHVVEGSNDLSVGFIDDQSVNATIKGTDVDSDLAVIAVSLKDISEDTLSQISIAKLGNSDELKVGQGVIAIGNALGYGQSTTVGYVSALDREVKTEGNITRHLLQTDAAINPGNSGGALLNMKGEVVGINAAKYSSTDVEGIGYAIPVSQVQDIIDSLMTKRTRNHAVEEGQEGYLGIQALTVDESMVKQLDMPAGVFVYAIIDGGAASKSDLREKDVITKFDDQSIRSMAALEDLLQYYRAGETVNLTVQSLENGKYVERTVEITLGEKTEMGQETQRNSPR